MDVLNIILDVCGVLFLIGVARGVGMLMMGYFPKSRWIKKK